MGFFKRLFGQKDPNLQPEGSRGSSPPPASGIDGEPASGPTAAHSVPKPGDSSPGNRSVRVFVSSTFRDMLEERDELMTHTWPELRRFCSGRHVEIVEVDLRWGISEEQSSRKETLKLCLDEIHSCRPFFIGLLGERYGWVPGEEAFSADLREEQPWLQGLRGKSVTELEILHGVLNNPEMARRGFFYFRDPAYVEKVPAKRKADFLPESPAAAAQQNALKATVRETCAVKRIPLRENYPEPQRLAALVLEDLEAAIGTQFPVESIPDPLTREARDHDAFAETRRRVYIGRPDDFEFLDGHAMSDGGPLVLLGESGGGKSALLANWLFRWRKTHPQGFVFQHYIGGTPRSADHWALMQRLMGDIKRWCDDPADLPVSHDDILRDFPVWLAKAQRKASRDGVRAIVVLDALNQLEQRDRARLLGWLPVQPFTGPLRLVVSTLPGETLQAVERRQWATRQVEALTVDERRRMIAEYLGRFGKKLDASRLERLGAAPAGSNPLYLKTILDELRVTGTHDRMDECLAEYLAVADIPDLLQKVLGRYERDYERDRKGLVGEALGLIWAARRGLTENELLRLLRPPSLPQLPLATWAPLRAALEESLVDRGGVLNLAHEFLHAAVKARYLRDPEAVRAARLKLAADFEAQPISDRQADELPWLLWKAEARSRLRGCLLDLDRFKILSRDDQEILGYWLWLGEEKQLGTVYLQAFEDWSLRERKSLDPLRVAFLASYVGVFLEYCGHFVAAEPLYRRALEATERVLGAEHPSTLTSVGNLARLLQMKGDYVGAELLYRRALEATERVLGAEHPGTLAIVDNLGLLLQMQGDYVGAESLLRRGLEAAERVLGAEHPGTLASVNNLAVLLYEKGDYVGAEPLYRRGLEANERVLGAEHPKTLVSVNNLAALLESKGDDVRAEPLHRRALKARERVLGAEHPDTLTSVNDLALLLQRKGDCVGAEPLYRRVLEARERMLGAEHPGTLTSVNNLGSLLSEKGDYVGAEPLYRRGLEANERVLGAEHPKTLVSVNNLAHLLYSKGDYAGAEPLFRRALEARERVLGAEHPDTLTSMNDLGCLLDRRGDNEGAYLLLRRELEARERALGADHPDTLTSVNNLATVLEDRGDFSRAEPLLRRALEARERALGADHPDTLASVNYLGVLLLKKEDYAGAEPLYRRALEARERVLGADHPDTLASVNYLGVLLLKKEDYAGAEPLYRRALEARERVLGAEHPKTLVSVNNLAHLLYSKGDYAGAEPLFRRALEARERVLGAEHPDTLASVNNLALLLQRKGDYVGAEPLYRRVLEARERMLGAEHPGTLASVNNLALLLYSKGDYAGAEPLFRRALEARERVLGAEHPDTLASIDNLAICRKARATSPDRS